MEKISYEEAREWFWIRTSLWTTVAAIVTVMALFGYSAELVKVFSTRLWISILVGVAVPLLGLTAATLSLQFPWMRLGWRGAYLLNAPVSTAISAALAFFVCGVILSFMQNDPTRPPSAATIHAAYMLMRFGIAGAAFWGLIHGTWFALRKDKYFVEPI